MSLLYGSEATSTSITYAVSLYALGAGNLPTGSSLSPDTGVGATWTGTTPGELKQQTFSYTEAALPNLFSVSLAGKAKYALVLSQDSGLPMFEHYRAQGLNSNGYAAASGFSPLGEVFSGDNGSNWTYTDFASHPTWDQSFIASIAVTAAPVPSQPLGLWRRCSPAVRPELALAQGLSYQQL